MSCRLTTTHGVIHSLWNYAVVEPAATLKICCQKKCVTVFIPVSNSAWCSLCWQNPITFGSAHSHKTCAQISKEHLQLSFAAGINSISIWRCSYWYGKSWMESTLTKTAPLNSRLYLANSLQSKHDLLLRWHLVLHSSGRRHTFLRYEWS